MSEKPVPYKVTPPAGALKPWLKLVQDVIPEKGNGWDIKGPFVPLQGVSTEGECFCLGYGLDGGRTYPIMCWRALQVRQGAPDNVFVLEISGGESVAFTTAALKAFPQLAPVAMKPMFAVQFGLLTVLCARASAHTEAAEPAKQPVRRIVL